MSDLEELEEDCVSGPVSESVIPELIAELRALRGLEEAVRIFIDNRNPADGNPDLVMLVYALEAVPK